MAKVRTGRVGGQVVVGDHNCVINAAKGSTVSVHQGGPPPVTLRDEPGGDRLPRTGAVPHGRDAEIARVDAWLAADRPVEIRGVPGVGKSALLRELAEARRAEGRHVVYLSASGLPVADVLRKLFVACYDADDYQPDPARLGRLMGAVDALFLIDDFAGSAENVDRLLAATPGGDLVIATGRPCLGGSGASLELTGLGEDAALALIEAELGRPLRDEEDAPARELCRAASGHPRALRRAVDAARGADSEFGFEPDPAVVARALVDGLDGVAREALLVLSLLDAAPLSAALLATLTGAEAGDAVRALERLADAELAVPTRGAYRRVPPSDDDGTDRPSPAADDLALYFRRLADWAATASAHEIADEAAIVTRLLAAAVEGGEHATARDLARAAAPALQRSLRWGSWRTVLALGLVAARELNSADDLHYFRHEENVRRRVLGLAGATAGGAAAGGLFALFGAKGGGVVSAHPVAFGAATVLALTIAGLGVAAARDDGPPPHVDRPVAAPVPSWSRTTPSATMSPSDAWLRLSAASVKAGAHYGARVGGMEPGETVVLSWTGPASGRAETLTADRDGTAEADVRAATDPGRYTIRATGRRSGRGASAPLTVEGAADLGAPTLRLSPSAPRFRDPIQATASGFEPGETVLFYMGMTRYGHGGAGGEAKANASGVAVAVFGEGWEPATGDRNVTVHAEGLKSKREAHATVHYQLAKAVGRLSARPDHDPVQPGETVTISGTGFAPGWNVQWYYPGYGNATSGRDDGTIEFTLRVPDDARNGRLRVHISQEASGRETDVTLHVQAGPSATP
ncbi:hypothetical protein BTM25_51570 [Actinomadura rubteroloni]|uniref:ATP-binding protein n=1 Tax=Actinomadura rubteroloni TaxID=1926885 RepID=A0A2P4UD35_9ACTN|nr:hypothetical protein [Actinomadura rubteroloni]POM22951.1 hypothetical protein BTM25_51570 [Actinomadura rubteroloni]